MIINHMKDFEKSIIDCMDYHAWYKFFYRVKKILYTKHCDKNIYDSPYKEPTAKVEGMNYPF